MSTSMDTMVQIPTMNQQTAYSDGLELYKFWYKKLYYIEAFRKRLNKIDFK